MTDPRQRVTEARDHLVACAIAIHERTKPGHPIDVTLHAYLIASCRELEDAEKALVAADAASVAQGKVG